MNEKVCAEVSRALEINREKMFILRVPLFQNS